MGKNNRYIAASSRYPLDLKAMLLPPNVSPRQSNVRTMSMPKHAGGLGQEPKTTRSIHTQEVSG